MPAIAAAPFLLTNCTVGIGSDTYEAAIRTLRFKPTMSVVRWKGLTPTSRFTFNTDPEWTVDITFAQDLASASSLSKYLHNTAAGTKVTMTFDPIAGGATITASIVVQPADIGGDIDTVPESTVTLAVHGQPALGA